MLRPGRVHADGPGGRTFLVHHWLGLAGRPRRYTDHAAGGFTGATTVSSLGAFLFGASTLPFPDDVWSKPTQAALPPLANPRKGTESDVQHE